jgi:hypothetical protein
VLRRLSSTDLIAEKCARRRYKITWNEHFYYAVLEVVELKLLVKNYFEFLVNGLPNEA